MATQNIYANKVIGITELKRKNTDFINDLNEPIALLKRDVVKAYLIPEQLMSYLIEKMEDEELAFITNERIKNITEGKATTIKVNINEL